VRDGTRRGDTGEGGTEKAAVGREPSGNGVGGGGGNGNDGDGWNYTA